MNQEKINKILEKSTRKALCMPLIYVSGAFRAETSWGIEQNIRKAENYALDLWKLGAAALCPHTNTRFYQGELPDEAWLAGDLVMLKGCDAIFMLPEWEKSEGACIELEFAKILNKKVLYTLNLVEQYVINHINKNNS